MNPSETIRIYGVVQGVGFRPYVSRLATRFGLNGSVANKGSFVEVHAQGTEQALADFRAALVQEAPPRSTILKVDTLRTDEALPPSFEIIESEKQSGDIFVSPDIATCELCREELYDPHNRRYQHPFINCTACGPRVTILDAMPYDRERTAMAEFPMCEKCSHEYTSPESRRYDAQPVCCNDCGPETFILGDEKCRGLAAITRARRVLLSGGIVAVKGIGGFHLACDAANEAAVARLRILKRRPMKPFAVMMKDLPTVSSACELSPAQEKYLTGPQKPIILLRRHSGSRLAPSVAPGNPDVGVMLPYAPLQMLLFDCADDISNMTSCLVMTSGNVSGAPICRTDADARNEISSYCDLILTHNRAIRLRCDDSVMDFLNGEPYMIRRSRGYAPLPFMMPRQFKGEVLGIGGELKNTFCAAKDTLFYPSPYIGDMADMRTVDALRASIKRLTSLLEISPKLVACDLHPQYNTTAAANELGVPVLPVQHHYAHILSCMAENGYLEPVLGVSFDGTGYGTDRTIWGGEILKCSLSSFERLASITPFPQPGGDASSRDGWRIACAMIHQLCGETAPELIEALKIATPEEFAIQKVMIKQNINTVTSTSAGRLFDAVAAILNLRRHSTYEGEAATALQFAAETADAAASEIQPFSAELIPGASCQVMDTAALVRKVIELRLAGTPVNHIARFFHFGLAHLCAKALHEFREQTRLNTVALSGGVCQNTLFTSRLMLELKRDGFCVLVHKFIPPNDGGLCLGQALAAMAAYNAKA